MGAKPCIVLSGAVNTVHVNTAVIPNRLPFSPKLLPKDTQR
ncbi:hypothetical protein ACTXJ5_10035 [Psychrobacter alimentarius]